MSMRLGACVSYSANSIVMETLLESSIFFEFIDLFLFIVDINMYYANFRFATFV